MSFIAIIEAVSILLTGLIAGLFYGFEVSVIGGLGRLSDIAYLQAFKSINLVILRPAFFFSFLGSLVVMPFHTWLLWKTQVQTLPFWLMCGACLIYFVLVFGITIVGNIPLNNLLAQTDLSLLGEEEAGILRQKFELRWNRYHSLRTWFSVLVFTAVVFAAILEKR